MVIYGAFFSFHCHFHLIWENWLQICPPPQDFDEITPLLVSSVSSNMPYIFFSQFQKKFGLGAWQIMGKLRTQGF
jgi:hypothetical protein